VDTSVSEKRQILKEIPLQKGRDVKRGNLQSVLDALWKVADTNQEVARTLYESQLIRLRKYFLDLKDLRCVELFRRDERGSPWYKVQLIKRELPKQIRPMENAAKVARARLLNSNHSTPPKKKVVNGVSKVEMQSYTDKCLVFIDAPNLCNVSKDNKKNRGNFFLSPFRGNWSNLREIALKITGVPFAHQEHFFYVRLGSGQKSRFQNICTALEKSGIHVKPRYIKDIDPMLLSDLLPETIPHLRKGRQVTLVLASGDGDYAFGLEKVLAYAEAVGAKLRIIILSWSECLSPALMDVAYEFIPFEKHAWKIDPAGAFQYAQTKQAPLAQMGT
jgi:uncharacterized LabA/DUF88 family protein